MNVKGLFVAAVFAAVAVPACAQDLAAYRGDRIVIQDVQTVLIAQGYLKGSADGTYNSKTAAALAKFVRDKGLSGADLADQLEALGVDLAAAKHLNFKLKGDYLAIDNGLPDNFAEMHYQYDWKSFDLGRYVVDDAGEEHFVLDDQYCDRFHRGPGSDCSTHRFRVQVRDVSPTPRHVLYSFEFRVDHVPAAYDGPGNHIQFAELNQNGGINARHPETGLRINYSPRFTLEVEDGKLIIQDNSMQDVSVMGGSLIKDARQPMKPGEWAQIVLETVWSTKEDGLFRYWFNGKALWERKGRNTTCDPAPGRDCQITLKYGPYGSFYKGPSFVDDPIRFSYRNMKRVFGDADVAAFLASYATDFAVHTARVGGATKATRISVVEQHSWSDDPLKVNSHLHAKIAGAKKGQDDVDVNVQGGFRVDGSDFASLRMVFNPPLGKEYPKALSGCGGARPDQYDDKQYRAVLAFRKDGKDWVAMSADCAIENSTPQVAFMMRFVLASFREMALGMVTSGNVNMVQNDIFRDWIRRVASGDIVIR